MQLYQWVEWLRVGTDRDGLLLNIRGNVRCVTWTAGRQSAYEVEPSC